ARDLHRQQLPEDPPGAGLPGRLPVPVRGAGRGRARLAAAGARGTALAPLGGGGAGRLHSVPGDVPHRREHRTARKGDGVGHARNRHLGGVRAMSRPIDKVALALGIVLLALGPLVLTLLRADSYHSTSYISL